MRTLNRCEVRYLIVGGYAVMLYTEPRFTKDLDVWVDATAENALRVFRALAEFGAPLSSVRPEDFAKADLIYQLGVPPIRIDVLTSISGIDFSEAWERRTDADFDGLSAHFLSLRDLIANKRTTGRLSDLADCERLEEAAGNGQ